jgi:tRNA dimethylallyltransferase
MSENLPLIIIAGPTCVGKTGTAIALARPLGGEIIGADAMQVYRRMDIGTAKPTKEECAIVTHHLIDVVEPDEPFSAADFKAGADAVIRELHKRDVLPFVVGGTGLYMKVLTRGLFETRTADAFIRDRLTAEAETAGLAGLYGRLGEVDPEAAARIHPNDRYRIIRALEVFESTGSPISSHHQAHGFSDCPYRVFKIGLFMDREILYDRIDRRVEQMIGAGFVEEVKGLLHGGFGPELKSMQSIGYRHVTAFLLGDVPWDEAVETFKRDTRRYAKRQLTWFRADKEMAWFEPSEIRIMREKIERFLEG